MKYVKTQDLLNQNTLTYREILNLKKRFRGYTKNKDITLDKAEFKEEYRITPDHTQKGLVWLYRIAFKPSRLEEQKARYEHEGIIHEALRNNCPLGWREIHILLQFDHFTFTGFYDASNYAQVQMGFKVLYPLWKVYDQEGCSFEYYLEGGKINIIG